MDLSRIEHGLSLLLSPYPSKVSLQLTIVVKKTYDIMRESERERVYAAASSLVRKEKGVITPAREMKIRRGLEGGEEGAVSQLNPRCLSWSF